MQPSLYLLGSKVISLGEEPLQGDSVLLELLEHKESHKVGILILDWPFLSAMYLFSWRKYFWIHSCSSRRRAERWGQRAWDSADRDRHTVVWDAD